MCPFVLQLAAAGLDTAGNKAELSSRVKTLRSGKPLPAASECACGVAFARQPCGMCVLMPPRPPSRAVAAMASTPAPKSSDSGDAAKTIARLEEELTLARQMTQAAVTRAEKAEAALAAAGGQQAPAAGGGGGSTSPAILKLHVKVAFGDTVLLCGSHASLGAWDVAGAATLSWTEGDVWQAQVALPQEGRLEMKFLVRTADGGLVWQAGSNLAVEVPKGAPGGDAVPAERSFNFAGTWAVGSSRASLTAEGPMAEADIPKPKKEEPPAPAPEPAPPAAEAAAPEPTPPAPEPEAAPAAAEAPAAEAPAAEAPAAEAAEPTA